MFNLGEKEMTNIDILTSLKETENYVNLNKKRNYLNWMNKGNSKYLRRMGSYNIH